MKKCQACGKETNLITGLGPVLLCTDECYPDAMIEIEAANAEGKSIDVRLWARRRYNRLHDTTRTERVNRRNEELDKLAQGLGFDGLSQFLTAWKNGEVKVTVERNKQIYVNEENLGSEASEAQAQQVIEILQGQGWNVAYGDSLTGDHLTDSEQAEFDRAFYQALEQAS